MNKSHPVAVLLIAAVAALLAATPVHAEEFSRQSRHRLFGLDTGPVLFQPRQIRTGPRGRIAVWDEGLQQFFFLTYRGDTDPSVPTRPAKLSRLLQQYRSARASDQWGELGAPTGFWDARGRFWMYDARLATQSGSFPVNVIHGPEKQTRLSGPLRSVVPGDEHWFLQPDTGPLQRWDPLSRSGLVDTASQQVKGRLIAVSERGRVYTRQRDKIRVYRNGTMLFSRTFSRLTGLDFAGGNLFVLIENRRLLRLDSNLAIKFTFDLNDVEKVHDFTVRGDRLFLISSNGLQTARLDESQSSFFWASQTLEFKTLARSLPDFWDQRNGRRIWVARGDDGSTVAVHTGSRRVDRFRYEARTFRPLRGHSMDQLPLSGFQYFQTESTFWDGSTRLYYFFPQEQVVESYDRGGRVIRRTSPVFGDFEVLQDVKFLGADEDRILFSGKMIYRGHGFRRSVIVFDWEGKLRRVFRLHHPEGQNPSPEIGRDVRWRYDGEGHIYALHAGYILQYDLMGYPQQVIDDVLFPVDLAVSNSRVFVMDLNGWRISSYTRPDPIHPRFATPPDPLQVQQVTPGKRGQYILAALNRATRNKHAQILAYRHSSRRYETVFQHPNRDLRYPLVSDRGDSLYFWGMEDGTRHQTLYRSDLIRYEARPLNRLNGVSGSGIHDPDRDMLIVPVRTEGDTPDNRYRYVYPGDTVGVLQNTKHLQHLERGGFTGFYGVWKSDTQSVVGSGYLHREGGFDTAPWKWAVSDTYAVLEAPVRQLLAGEEVLYLSVASGQGFSRLGWLDPPKAQRDADTGTLEPSWLMKTKGVLTWVEPAEDPPLLMQKPERDGGGHLLEIYRSGDPPTGGLQGDLVTGAPVSLEGISLRTDPGGFWFETGSGGQFSLDDLPVGHLEVIPNSYSYHFQIPFRVNIQDGQYTVQRGVNIQSEKDLLLVEKGLDYFRKGKLRRARISLQAFMELVQEGPAFRWGEAVLKEINQIQGRMDSLMEIYRRSPHLFDMRDRLRMIRVMDDDRSRLSLLRSLLPASDPYLDRVLRYRIYLLERRRFLGGATPEPDPRPVFSRDGTRLPVVVPDPLPE